ncbi:MAG TPA: hypothetical protein VN706_23975 [Gemmatimonadaceae bacterium]|nr:hypothetical protein [Gemmatimonadaceae bacterium]
MRASRTHASARLAGPLAAALLIAGIAACAETFRAGSAGPTIVGARAEQMFDAGATRFSPNDFSPRYKTTRLKLASGALVPSRVFDDTSVWDARPTPTRREVFVQGGLVDGRYRLDQRPSLTPASRLGDTRHTITLDRLEPSIYRWQTRVDMAIGTITAQDVSDVFTALFASAQNRDERALRDDYRAAFPRAMASFGKGFSLDSLRTISGGSGSTAVSMTIGFHPELMRASYPGLAGYLDKYLGPAKYHFLLAERTGGAVFEVTGRDRAMTIRYRVQQGKLVSLLGPPKPWSDTLVLNADLTLKVKMFTVGFHNLITDFVISNTTSNNAHDRAWTVLAQREPDWNLPLITERLIRSPLRRPFEAPGAMIRLAIRDSGSTSSTSNTSGAQSIFERSARLDVQESSIMRFIGSLASHAVGDIDDRVELDEHRFLHDGFVALQNDLIALRR